jgi:hypothetical protein
VLIKRQEALEATPSQEPVPPLPEASADDGNDRQSPWYVPFVPYPVSLCRTLAPFPSLDCAWDRHL